MKNQEMTFITQKDYVTALEKIMQPLRQELLFSSTSGLNLGTSGAVYTQQRAEMEALIRPLWGLSALWTIEKDSPLQLAYLEKITQGTDPTSPVYWGDIQNYDQYIVESAALSLTILLHKDYFFDALPKKSKTNLINWLNQALERKIPKNNWTFFKILIRIALSSCGEKLDQQALDVELKLIDSMYLGDGWYKDGQETQRDYYVPFAFHYYGLIYATFMKDIDPVRSKIFIERATYFSKDFIYYFDEDGEALPFGRSLTYRFAQAAFFSALIFADVEAIPWGEMKTLMSAHLTNWMNHDIFTVDGRLSIGYHYENLIMAEGYNAPGSPYWGLKFFLLLAVPDTHPFWQASPVPLSKRSKKLVHNGNMLLHYNHNHSHLLGYPAGLMLKNQAHAQAKYSKFVYSTKFGFSVPKASISYEEGAFDNALAVSCDLNSYYRTKGEVTDYLLTETYTTQTWHPFEGVSITTTIYPFGEWHLRVHEIETSRSLDLREGGFSVPLLGQHPKATHSQTEACIHEGKLTSQIVAIEGYDTAEIIRPEVNTSLFFPRTSFPSLQTTISAGKHRLICLVGGIVSNTTKKGR